MWIYSSGRVKKQPKLHRGQNVVSNIPCVNDHAERVIDLIDDLYANCTDEILQQCLLQIVEKKGKELEGCNCKLNFMTIDNI